MSDVAITEVLVFTVSGAEFALPADRVRSVSKTLAITPVPYLPEGYQGLVNFRGDLCLAIDLVPIAGQKNKMPRPFMIVLEPKEKETRPRSVLVDSIDRVLSTTEAASKGITVLSADDLLKGAA